VVDTPGQRLRGHRPIIADKYRVVADFLAHTEGRLLDVGARDRRLSDLLGPTLEYYSADIMGRHDYVVDLERPLPLPDRAFDFVVALDVLEHVEAIQSAFDELARITNRRMFIALPNIGSARHRLAFLIHGRLATGKYDLGEQHPGDRHRWLTVYNQIDRFVEERAQANRMSVRAAIDEVDCGRGGFAGRLSGALALHLANAGLISSEWMTSRTIFELDREHGL
jgi:hypothetical protein